MNDLQVLINKFLEPIRAAATTTHPILTLEEINSVFTTYLDVIIPHNSELLKNLKLIDLSNVDKNENEIVNKICRSFLEVSPYLKCYSYFCSAYSDCEKNCKRLIENNKKFKKFLDETYKIKEVKKMDLISFLIKPVQRICKYPLFFRELSKEKPIIYDEFTKNLIEKTLKKLSDLAEDVNSKMTSAKASDDLLKLFQSFGNQPPNFVLPHRRLIHTFHVKVGKSADFDGIYFLFIKFTFNFILFKYNYIHIQ